MEVSELAYSNLFPLQFCWKQVEKSVYIHLLSDDAMHISSGCIIYISV